MGMKQVSIFDRIISELSTEDSGTEELDRCMQFDYSLSRKVPLRYKIISVGFVRDLSLEEVNQKLQEYGLPKLYARNLWEATLMYAFSNKLSYDSWRELIGTVQRIREQEPSEQDPLDLSGFSMKALKNYIDANSNVKDAEILTKHRTQYLESCLSGITEENEFAEYIRSNISTFSTVREKARYYFCKYLYSYLDRKIDRYIRTVSSNINAHADAHSPLYEEALFEETSIFKGASKIRNKKMTEEEIREYLENASISCGILYSEFNEFFFGYVSLDWMQVLLERYGNIRDLPPKSVRKLADAAKQYDSKYKKMKDADILMDLAKMMEQQEAELDRQYSLDSRDRGYQKNRMGENTVRKYLKGSLDLDRTTLICFLLFFGSDITKTSRLYVDAERMNTILKESGFRELDEYNDFDYFIVNYLRAEDPSEYLMKEVTVSALLQKNFYLYKLYQNSRSDDADFRRLIAE